MESTDLRRILAGAKGRVVHVVYIGADKEPKSRYLRPYEIKEEHRYDYLFATDITENHHAIKKFRLDRIQSLEVTPLTFQPVWPIQL
jgi:predicted DNA-binding transcriptional regulator YafY